VKPANLKENRRDRRLASNQSGKRKAVIIIRERNGRSLPTMFRTEGQALSFIRARIEAYSLDGACTNWAEEFFSRMRRAEAGHHHHFAGVYLLRYAQEASWREDHRRISNGDQVHLVSGLAMKRGHP
jgi:hypothetical protein